MIEQNNLTIVQQQMSQHPAMLASVGALRTTLNLQYREQVYTKTIDTLAGVSFEPLAGIRVTFLPAVEGHQRAPEASNVIFHAQYVEYLTGHRRTLMASVELLDGYVPIGVERKAFNDALLSAIEFQLNECGYTTQEQAPDGLRRMIIQRIGHGLLSTLFDPMSAIAELKGFDLPVTVTVEADAVVLRVPTYKLYREVGFDAYSIFDGPHCDRFNRIQRNQLGALKGIAGKNLWLLTERKDGIPNNRGYLSEATALKNPYDVIKHRDGSTTTRNYHEYTRVWTVNETPDPVVRGQLPSGVSGTVRDGMLTLRIQLDLATDPRDSDLVFEGDDQWVELRVHGIGYVREDMTPGRLSAGLKVARMTRDQDSKPAPMGELGDVLKIAESAVAAAQQREQKQSQHDPLLENYLDRLKEIEEEARGLGKVTIPPSADPYLHPSLALRFKAAFDAFMHPAKINRE